MLVQLSDWRLASTSLSTASATKQRRRSRSNSNCSQDVQSVSDIQATLSIVPASRRFRHSKRRKGEKGDQQDDVIPIAVVTTAHGIGVVGKAPTQNQQEDTFRESSRMQYLSRPGKQSSFLPEGKKVSLPHVPAVIDGKSELVYALQSQNSVLVCWNTGGDGPDDNSAIAARLSLPSPAMSMNIFYKSKGMPYGTLSGGRVFVGVWKGTSLELHTFDSPQPDDAHHVCTIMTQIAKSSDQFTTGNKRKIADLTDEKFLVVQVFADSRGFSVVKNHVSLDPDGALKLNGSETTISRTPVVSKDPANVSIDPTCTLHAQNETSVAIAYQEVTVMTVINGKKKEKEEREQKLCHLSLANGQISGEPYAIAASIRQLGFVGDNLLAAATIDSISLYEVHHGTLIRSLSVADIVSDTKDWCLATDSKKGTIAILSSHSNKIHVAISSLSGNAMDSSNHNFTLADGLRSAMISNSHLVVSDEEATTKNLLGLLASKNKRNKTVTTKPEDTVAAALAVISSCLDNILDPKDETTAQNVLLDAYEEALSRVLPPSWTPPERSAERKNGTKSSNPKFENMHFLPRGRTPSLTPQAFVDGATALMLATLQLPRTENKVVGLKISMARLDARLILYRLIRSGKVSARRHFQIYSEVDTEGDLLFSILRAVKLGNKHGRRVVSPVDLIHEMLSGCDDLTERQLVTMIHYMMCKALPEDIAENFLGWHPFDDTNRDRLTAKAFFRAKSDVWKLKSENRPDKKVEKKLHQSIEELSTKILKAGFAFLLERILTYSRLNETLLRTALSQRLVHKHEAPALALALLDILDTTEGKIGRHVAATRWIFVLCEACHDTLSSESENGKNRLSLILERLQKNVEINTCMLTLGPVLESVRGLRDETNSAARKVKNPSNFVQKERPTRLAAYSIEQLIL